MREPGDALLAWAAAHLPAIERARDAYDDSPDGD